MSYKAFSYEPFLKAFVNQRIQHNFIGVDGNIGAGKSSLCRLLEAFQPGMFRIAEEPQTSPYLADQYLAVLSKNPSPAVYRCQSDFLANKVIATRNIAEVRDDSGTIQFQDRTIYADGMYFARSLEGLMMPGEPRLYFGAYLDLLGTIPRPSVILYIHSDPAICFPRLKASRPENEVPDLSYLIKTMNGHDELMERLGSAQTMLNDVRKTRIAIVDTTGINMFDLDGQNWILEQVTHHLLETGILQKSLPLPKKVISAN